jgi:hypothetical protein
MQSEIKGVRNQNPILVPDPFLWPLSLFFTGVFASQGGFSPIRARVRSSKNCRMAMGELEFFSGGLTYHE